VACCQHTAVAAILRRTGWLAAAVLAIEIIAGTGFHH
jgi:hypothetical protein